MPTSLGIPEDRFYYFPNFVDCKVKKLNCILKKESKFLFVGRVSPEKGLDTLVLAVENLVYKKNIHNFSVDIIGVGSDMNRIIDLIERKKLNSYFTFCGKLSPGEILKVYSQYLALIVPSVILENNPLVILESMSQGLPVIGSRVGGIPDLVKDGENGYLFSMGNYYQLSILLSQFTSNKNLSNILGKKAKLFYEMNFTEKCYLDRFLNFLLSKF